MRDRAAANSSKSSQLPAPEYYSWQVPGRPVSIQLLLDVVDRLETEIMDAFWAVPKRGAEIGGLLLGRKDEAGTVVVEDYELVPCEYQHGPSYRLSSRDTANLGQAIASRAHQKDRQVVGYFRSHTREGFQLEEDDGSLIRQYFADPGSVVLLVRPFASKCCAAGFFLWEDGTIRPESNHLEFPFRRSELTRTLPSAGTDEEPAVRQSGRPEFAAEREAASQKEPVPHPEPRQVPPAGPNMLWKLDVWPQFRALAQRRYWALAAVTSLALVILQYGIFRLVSSSPSGSARHEESIVPLSVERVGQLLRITWNRKARAVAEARRGVLLITDGGYRKELHLGVTQLRSGSVAYVPLTRDVDVNFQLNLEGNNHATVTESLRVVIPPPPETVPAQPPTTLPSVTTVPVSTQAQADAKPLKVPAKPRIKPRRRAFFDDGL